MKRFLVHFKSPGGDQYMEVAAADKDEAKRAALDAQAMRHARFPMTFQRIEERTHIWTGASDEQVKRELERRKRDQGRYDDGNLKIASIKEIS